MATIGYRAAVADAFGMKFTGLIAYLMWMFIHMLYLIGWGNRIGTIYTWLRALVFTKNRGHRMITFEQAANRIDEDTPQQPTGGRDPRTTPQRTPPNRHGMTFGDQPAEPVEGEVPA